MNDPFGNSAFDEMFDKTKKIPVTPVKKAPPKSNVSESRKIDMVKSAFDAFSGKDITESSFDTINEATPKRDEVYEAPLSDEEEDRTGMTKGVLDKDEEDEFNPEENPEDAMEDKPEPEEEEKPLPMTKEYLGKTEDQYYYILPIKDENTDEIKDLTIVDQDGNEKLSALDAGIDRTDVVAFLNKALTEIEIAEVDRGILVKYLFPILDAEKEKQDMEREEMRDQEFEEQAGEEGEEGAMEEPIVPEEEEEMPFESKKGVKSKKINEVTLEFDGETFDVQLVESGEQKTIISVNGHQFSYTSEFVSMFMNENGAMTEEGLKELAEDALSTLEPEQWDKLVAENSPSESDTYYDEGGKMTNFNKYETDDSMGESKVHEEKQKFHLIPSEREKECKHPMGFSYKGKIPCTGPKTCNMCGMTEEEAKANKNKENTMESKTNEASCTTKDKKMVKKIEKSEEKSGKGKEKAKQIAYATVNKKKNESKIQESIYSDLKATGAPMDSHESDLYVLVTPETQKIIDGYENKQNVKKFKSQKDGKVWFDVPFANDTFWNSKTKNIGNESKVNENEQMWKDNLTNLVAILTKRKDLAPEEQKLLKDAQSKLAGMNTNAVPARAMESKVNEEEEYTSPAAKVEVFTDPQAMEELKQYLFNKEKKEHSEFEDDQIWSIVEDHLKELGIDVAVEAEDENMAENESKTDEKKTNEVVDYGAYDDAIGVEDEEEDHPKGHHYRSSKETVTGDFPDPEEELEDEMDEKKARKGGKPKMGSAMTGMKKVSKKNESTDTFTTIFPSTSKKVNDSKNHYAINNLDQAKLVIDRIKECKEVPSWYKGTLKEMTTDVNEAISKKYPNLIEKKQVKESKEAPVVKEEAKEEKTDRNDIVFELLGLNESKTIGAMPKVGDTIQILHGMEILESKAEVFAIDEKKGVEITGNKRESIQQWFKTDGKMYTFVVL